MAVAFVGCGYVFDIYMRTQWAYSEIEIAGVYDIDAARLETVSRYYGFATYDSLEALLADPKVSVVVNLTSINAHYRTIKQALLAGKHVYSEKPLTTDVSLTRELFALAEERGVVLTGAPCNVYSDSIATIWKAIRDGAIGKPVLIYAELDDNPAHLMSLERVRSPTGAPFPYAEEFQEGCTVEHVAYHLVWICAMFGPAVSVTGFSTMLVEDKTETPLTPADTPDLSVACLTFSNGLSARITCSWVAPRDHSFQVIGVEGALRADNVFHDQSAVRLERFSRVSLSARKSYSLRNLPTLGRLFGIQGSRIPLLTRWKSHALVERGVGRSLKHRFVSWLRHRETYAQDKMLGIGEMLRALQDNRPQPMQPDFLLHINELTMLIHKAGEGGMTAHPQTSFQPFEPMAEIATETRNYKQSYRPRFIERAMANIVDRMHR